MSDQFTNALKEMLELQHELRKQIREGESLREYFERVRMLQDTLEGKLKEWKSQLDHLERFSQLYQNSVSGGVGLFSPLLQLSQASPVLMESLRHPTETPTSACYTPPRKRLRTGPAPCTDSLLENDDSKPMVLSSTEFVLLDKTGYPAEVGSMINTLNISEIIAGSTGGTEFAKIVGNVIGSNTESTTDAAQIESAVPKGDQQMKINGEILHTSSSTTEKNLVADGELPIRMSEIHQTPPPEIEGGTTPVVSNAQVSKPPGSTDNSGGAETSSQFQATLNKIVVAGIESKSEAASLAKNQITNIAVTKDKDLIIVTTTGSFKVLQEDVTSVDIFRGPFAGEYPNLIGPFKALQILMIANTEVLCAVGFNMDLQIEPLLRTGGLVGDLRDVVDSINFNSSKLCDLSRKYLSSLGELNWTILPLETPFTKTNKGILLVASNRAAAILVRRAKLVSSTAFVDSAKKTMTLEGNVLFVGQQSNGRPFWVTCSGDSRILYRCKGSFIPSDKDSENSGNAKSDDVIYFVLNSATNFQKVATSKSKFIVGNFTMPGGVLKSFWFDAVTPPDYPYIYPAFDTAFIGRTGGKTIIVMKEENSKNVDITVYDLTAEFVNGKWSVVENLISSQSYPKLESTLGLVFGCSAPGCSEKFTVKFIEVSVSGIDGFVFRRHEII